MGKKLLTITIFGGSDCESFFGKFEEIQKKEIIDKETGEVRELEAMILTDKEGESFGIWLDAGLKNAIKYCVYGEVYEIKHTGKKQIEGNRQVNTYKVWLITPESEEN